MKELRNSFDKEVRFTDLEKAKAYYIPTEEPCEDDFWGEDFEEYCIDFKSYQKAIEEAESLEELADVLNQWSDKFDNGTRFEAR